MPYQSLARTFKAVHAVVCNLKIRNVHMAMQRGAFIDRPCYCSVCLSRVSRMLALWRKRACWCLWACVGASGEGACVGSAMNAGARFCGDPGFADGASVGVGGEGACVGAGGGVQGSLCGG